MKLLMLSLTIIFIATTDLVENHLTCGENVRSRLLISSARKALSSALLAGSLLKISTATPEMRALRRASTTVSTSSKTEVDSTP
ncbi:hypothetical protein F4678DRAFT_432985 [Xylaria arbuscula]|nr:hypothetical protein F4678DRAFT_432985 [Xylaria arbuscula]